MRIHPDRRTPPAARAFALVYVALGCLAPTSAPAQGSPFPVTVEQARATAAVWTGEDLASHQFTNLTDLPSPGYEFQVPRTARGFHLLVKVDGYANRVIGYYVHYATEADYPSWPPGTPELTVEQSRASALAFLAARGITPEGLGFTFRGSKGHGHAWMEQLPNGVWHSDRQVVVNTGMYTGEVNWFSLVLGPPAQVSLTPNVSANQALVLAAQATVLLRPNRFYHPYLISPLNVCTDLGGQQRLIWSLGVMSTSDPNATLEGYDPMQDKEYVEIRLDAHTGEVVLVDTYLGSPGKHDMPRAATRHRPRFRHRAVLRALRRMRARPVLAVYANARDLSYVPPHWRGKTLYWGAAYLRSRLMKASVRAEGERLHVVMADGRRGELRLGRKWLELDGRRVALRHAPYRRLGRWYLPAECWTHLTGWRFTWREREHAVFL